MVPKFPVSRKVHISLKEMICISHSSDYCPCCLYLPGVFFICLFLIQWSTITTDLVGKGLWNPKKWYIENKVLLLRALTNQPACWWDQALATRGGSTPQRDTSGNPFPPAKIQKEPNVWLLGTNRWAKVANGKHTRFLFPHFRNIRAL